MKNFSIANLFKTIDNFLFQKIDIIIQQQFYTNLIDTLGNLNDKSRRVMRELIGIVIVSIPVMIAVFIFILNMNLKNDIENKKEVLQLTNSIISKEKEYSRKSRFVFTNKRITTKNALNSSINSLLRKVKISPRNVTVKNFVNDDSTRIIRNTADLKFNQLSTNNIVDLIQKLVSTEKMKISSLTVKKDKKTKLLFGNIKINQFIRLLEEEE